MNREVYNATSASFRNITSFKSEEKRLKTDVKTLNGSITDLNKKIIDQNMLVNDLNKKIIELKIWIEVQKDFSFSRESYEAKVKGSLQELESTVQKIGKARLRKSQMHELKEKLTDKLNYLIKSLELVKVEVKSLKEAPDRGFIILPSFAGR